MANPQQAGATNNTFTKGMMKDYNETFVGEGMYTHARNGVNNSHDGHVGVIGNEPSNLKCITLNYTLIGCIHLLDDQWLLFSTDDVHSEVGVFDESACTYQRLKNKNGDYVDFDCLGLKRSNLITGVFRKRYDCERLVYWDDGLNPTRSMDIDNVPCVQNCTNNGTCTTCVDTVVVDCDTLRIAHLVQHPCITLSKGKLPGTLPNGSYQVAIAYTINELRVTDYIGLTEVQGLWSHENTSSSLDVTISHIDSSFLEFELVVLSNINAQTVCKRIGYYNTSRGHIHIDRWDPEFVTVPTGEVVIRTEPIEKSDAMYSVNNYLLRVGTYSKFKFNYQPLANQIAAKWTIVEYPKNYYQKGGNVVGYMRDEVYAFFIRFVYNTGEFSESYHIPGRAANGDGSDTDSVNGMDVYEASNLPKWKVYNTAEVLPFTPYSLNDGSGGVVTAQGLMGYWESDETYPSDKSYIWNSFPNLSYSPFNLCGKPIRHHRMPDETVGNGELDLYSANRDTIKVLGVKFENIQTPLDYSGNPIDSIVGYEILRGSREGNKSIIAKGLINNMREYSIPQNINKGLFINYPYNDLNSDPYLVDANDCVRPTGYNGNFAEVAGLAPDRPFTDNKMTKYRKDIFSFHSPDIAFSKPYLNSVELKLYSEHIGTSNGSFEIPYKYPNDKLASSFVGVILNLMGTLDIIDTVNKSVSGLTGSNSSGAAIQFAATDEYPISFSYSFPEFPKWPAITGSDAYGVSSWAMFAIATIIYAAEIVIWVTVVAALTILTVALNDIKREKFYKLFYALIPRYKFASQYISHGFYNTYAKITTPNNTRRQVLLANYVGSGIQQFDLGYQINNVNRGSGAVVVKLSNPIEPTTKDNSRVVNSDVGYGYNTNFTRQIASYYAALKLPTASQYGQIESIKQIPVSTCPLNIGNTSTGNTPLFGGDVYINRFTEKNTFFFFNTWLVGQPDLFEFNYCDYINIPYPRFWLNSQEWKVHFGTSPAQQRSLDSANAGGGINIGGIGATLWLEEGYFYLFNSGVRDFFCESEVNVAYRDYEEEITKRFYDPYGYTDITGETGMFRSSPEIITAGNYYKYDYSLSKSKLFNSHISWGETLPRDYNPAVAASCYVYRPNRVIYSLPQQNEAKKDSWRAFLPNNFKDFSSKVSSIKPVHKTGALFMMKYANPLMFMGIEELKLDTTGTKITIGDGALFSGVQQLQSVVNSDDSYEYGSNQGRFCAINCLHGVFWVSQNQGKVFQYGGYGGLQEISAGGMRWWFAKYLPSQLLKLYPDYPLYDNPVAGVGVQMIYDNTNELIYITKRDYIPKTKQSLTYGGKFVNHIPVGPEDNPSSVVQTIPSDFNNKDEWEEISWTITYDPKIKAWVSFHDWIPSFLIPGRSHFMSVAPESGSIVDSIWKHNVRCDSYCNFYGVDYPFEIEFLSATGQAVNSIRSIEYLLEVYNYSNDCRDKFHNLYENFDQAIVYNSEQTSGLLRLNLHKPNDPVGLLAFPAIDPINGVIDIQYSKVENKYRFNQFWDITNNRGQALPSPINIPMFNVDANGYMYNINSNYVNYSKNPLERKKFRHNVNRVFLRRVVSGNNKFIFKISNQKLLQSPR